MDNRNLSGGGLWLSLLANDPCAVNLNPDEAQAGSGAPENEKIGTYSFASDDKFLSCNEEELFAHALVKALRAVRSQIINLSKNIDVLDATDTISS